MSQSHTTDTFKPDSIGFDWIPFYEELAVKLLPYRSRQQELIDFLRELSAQNHKMPNLEDRDGLGNRFPLEEIDPFSFFGVFNRLSKTESRIRILQQMKKYFEIDSSVPSHFNGIPTLNPQKSWFFGFAHDRAIGDIEKLWDLFDAALDSNWSYGSSSSINNPKLQKAFDRALEVKYTNINATMGLFWIRPNQFISLDLQMRKNLEIKLPSKGISFEFYRDEIAKAKRLNKSFPEISYASWMKRDSTKALSNANYWLVGAHWNNQTPQDQTERFLNEEIWQNGYTDRYLDLVNQMEVGDLIAIKSTSTQKHDLPFNSHGNTVSKHTIKARGVIVSNHGDGRTVDVEWENLPSRPEWYFYTFRRTIWKLQPDHQMAKQLISFTFDDVAQDYQYFIDIWWPQESAVSPLTEVGIELAEPYSIADMLIEGVFLSEEEVGFAIGRLKSKRNLILQGAPGVGKTFVAKKLAYSLIESKDETKISTVQLHPSYSYEDFIRGFRPTDEAGKFQLKDGPFSDLCERAHSDPDQKYVLIIDEINRGNLSQIFGEVFSLIEVDKRGKSNAVTPLYTKEHGEKFFVPENIYIIGTMNLADRSLALVDYALRRRFAFMTLDPKFNTKQYQDWLNERGMDKQLITKIKQAMVSLNKNIEDDRQLGPAYRIGHSFFCPRGNDFSKLDMKWFNDIVDSEIKPLIQEYWFDDPDKVRELMADVFGRD